MSQVLTLYHGSSMILPEPLWGKGKTHNDYGIGFYCTEDLQLAKEWACTLTDDGYASRYTLNTEGMNILHLNSEDYTLLHWMALLVSHRSFRIKTPVAGHGLKYLTEHFSVDVDAYDLITG